MAKINIAALATLQRPAEPAIPVSRGFATEQGEMTLWFVPLEGVLVDQAHDISNRLIRKYVGYPEEDMKPDAPFAWTFPGDAPIITETVCRTVAQFAMMQPPGSPERYNEEELLYLRFVLPNDTWTAINVFAREVNRKKTDPGNALAVRMESTCASPSEETSGTPSSTC